MAAQVSCPLEDDAMVDDGFADDIRVRLLVLRCIRLESLLEQALPFVGVSHADLYHAISAALEQS